MHIEVMITDLPETRLAGITHIGEFEKTPEIYGRLLQWAAAKGLAGEADLKTVTIYHDNPRITAPSKVRWSACLVTDEDTIPEGEIRLISIQQGKYATGNFIAAPHLISQAWEKMCIWVMEHGYTFRDRDYFEWYHHGEELTVDIYIPVE